MNTIKNPWNLFDVDYQSSLANTDQTSSDFLYILNILKDLIKERADFERDYSIKLEALARKFSKKTSQALDSTTATASLDYNHCSLFKSCKHVLKEYEHMAKNRSVLADTFSNSVTDYLKNLALKKEEARKKHILFAQKLLTERDNIFTQKDKSNIIYKEACDLVEYSKTRYDRTSDDKQKEKLKKQWHQEIIDMNNAKNNYLLALNAANQIQVKFHDVDVPSFLSAMKNLNVSIATGVKYLLSEYVAFENKLIDSNKKQLDIMENSISSIDEHSDIGELYASQRLVINKNRPFLFEPTDLWKDCSTIAKDEFSIIYMQNKKRKIQKKLDELNHDISMKVKIIEALKLKLQKSPNDNLELSQQNKINEMISEGSQEICLLGYSQTKMNSHLKLLEKELGESDAHERPHNFKNCFFAIPTQCDFCLQSIWGVAKSGLSCRVCGFSAHLKCEMKISPNCSKIKGKPYRNISGGSSSLNKKVSSCSMSSESSAATAQCSPEVTLPVPLHNQSSASTIDTAIYGRILYNHVASQDSIDFADDDGLIELSVKEGDIVRVIQQDGRGWTLVADKQENIGVVPTSYMKVMENNAPEVKEKNDTVSIKSKKSITEFDESLRKVKVVLYDYYKNGEDEMTIFKGQNVHVLEADDGTGWITVLSGDKKGLVPTSYIQDS